MALTKAQAIDWINQSIGKHYNPDGAHGFQCKDYADAYAIALFGNWVNTLRPADAKFAFDNSNPDFFEKIRNNPNDANLIPQAGDIIVYNGWASNPYGHIAVVIDANIFGAMVVEQDGFLQIPARKIFHSYSKLPIIGWLRPKYQAETPAVQIDHTWRIVSADQGVNVRNEPTTKSGIFAAYPKNSEIQMKGWCKGQKVAGSDVWFISARSTKFIHSSAFDKGTDGLPHLTEFDKIEVSEEKKVEVQAPPAPKPAEFVGFEKEFDFVDRVEPVATSNQFYGRKNLKDEQGKYLSAIPDDYASQKAFVDSLDRPTHQIEEITIHNTTNTSISATLNEFRRKDSYKSSHLVVSNSEIVQCVRKTDTAFTNGSHESNIKSFTIEFLDDVSDDRYAEVLAKVSKALGVEKIGKHRDHSATACPAKLSDEKIAEFIAKINAPAILEPKTNNQPEIEQNATQSLEKPNDDNFKSYDNLEQLKKEILAMSEEQKNAMNATSNNASDVVAELAESETAKEILKKTPFWLKVAIFIVCDIALVASIITLEVATITSGADGATLAMAWQNLLFKAGVGVLTAFGYYRKGSKS